MTSRGLRRAVALAAASLFAIAAAGCGTSNFVADAATLTNLGDGADDVHITRADFEEELQKLLDNDDFRELLTANEVTASDENVDARIAASWLTQRITQAAIDAEFEARDAEVTDQNRRQAEEQLGNQFGGPQVVASFPESFREELIEDTARGFAVLDSYIQEPTEAEIRAFYEENRDQFGCETGKEVAHILVEDEARANELMAQLATGASFETLATQFSTDTGSASRGGNLGCLTRGAFVPEFEQAALAAAPGTPVGPVQTQFGYHIILTSAVEDSLDNARAQVVATLQEQNQQEAQAALLERLNGAKVKIDPRFGTWGEVDDGQGGTRRQVIPPEPVDVRDRRETTTTTAPPATGQGVP